MASARPLVSRLAIVTGGWRRIGAVIARRLAERGYDLALHAHHAEAIDPAFGAGLGVEVRAVVGDLAEPGFAESLPRRVAEEWGRPASLLVNSASLFREGDLSGLTRAELDAHLAVNFTAPVLLARGFAEALGEESGSVVHLLDQRVANPVPDQISYTLAKQALHASVRTLARGLAPRVRVNAVAPGPVLPSEDYTDPQWERLPRILPLQRMPTPEDIADAVAFLAGASAVTGQTLFVDGGASLEAYPRDFVYLER